MFKLNYDELKENTGGLMKEGFYEVLVEKAEEREYKGSKNVNIQLVVREDVDQAYKRKKIFHTIWRRKADGKYPTFSFNAIGKALGIENNKEYKSLEELLADFVGKAAKVKIVHEDFNDKYYERIAFWEPTKYPLTAQITEIPDEQLPF